MEDPLGTFRFCVLIQFYTDVFYKNNCGLNVARYFRPSLRGPAIASRSWPSGVSIMMRWIAVFFFYPRKRKCPRKWFFSIFFRVASGARFFQIFSYIFKLIFFLSTFKIFPGIICKSSRALFDFSRVKKNTGQWVDGMGWDKRNGAQNCPLIFFAFIYITF